MNRLFGHSAAAKHLHPGRVSEHGHAEPKMSESGCDMPVFARRPGGESESGLPVDRIGTKRSVLTDVSHTNPASCSVTASGSFRRPAACFRFAALRVTISIFDTPS